MEDEVWLSQHAERSIQRLLPRLKKQYASSIKRNPGDWREFEIRLLQNFQKIFGHFHHLYGSQYDFFYYLEELLSLMAASWFERSPDLKDLDREREIHPDWYLSNQMLGGICYVDLYAGNLEGLRSKLAYFKELGLTYLHLMPLFKMPDGENDGGYAVSSYREVDPRVGKMEELKELAQELRQNGISLVLDFVFNHTSDEHEWAVKAKSGEPEFENYYYIFSDEEELQAYQKTLREIFPEQRPGSFTFVPELERWVWTTFNSYQWDLNYSNPAVFNQMAREILFLANAGVEVLRLDAVAFIWKEIGTSCENLPEAHLIIQAFNTICRVAAPTLLFKSEAIVHPDEVLKYIGLGECQLSYNPLLMAMLWNSLATREIQMLKQALVDRYHIPEGCAWVNYVRCHDDIGWTFADEDAARLGINAYDHRQFLNAFYTGRFPGSFARGLPFQENPRTGDLRISGTCASLAGLEKAVNEGKKDEISLAIGRILLIHGIILMIGGIPLIYLGDEIGMLNDYQYTRSNLKAHDSRWVHRPNQNWGKLKLRKNPKTVEGRIYSQLKNLIGLRKNNDVFSNGGMEIMDSGSNQVLGFVRAYHDQRALVFGNFSEQEQTVPANILRVYGLSYEFTDLMSHQPFEFGDLWLAPFELKVLAVQ